MTEESMTRIRLHHLYHQHAAESMGRHHHPEFTRQYWGKAMSRTGSPAPNGTWSASTAGRRQYHRRGAGKPAATAVWSELGEPGKCRRQVRIFPRHFRDRSHRRGGSPECRPRPAQGRFGNGPGHFQRLAAGAFRPQELPGDRQGGSTSWRSRSCVQRATQAKVA